MRPPSPAALGDPEALFLEQLPRIDRIAASLCRRYALAGADAEDFASWVRLKLVEDGYAVLRKFRGESAIGTYLAVVVATLLREHRVVQWGRWRPSAEARRRGGVAVRLETLVRRDGYRLEQAAELLRMQGATDLPPVELGRLYARLPDRSPLRPVRVGDDALEGASAPGSAHDPAERAEASARRARLERALADALGRLPDEDRALLRMRFWDGESVADIARLRGLPQKPLYRRIDRAVAHMRRTLESAGVTREEVRAMLADLVAE